MFPSRKRRVYPRLETLLPHDVHVSQPLLFAQRSEQFQHLRRVRLQQFVRVSRDVWERHEFPAAPRQVGQNASELDAEEWTLPRPVEDFASVRHPESHVASSQSARRKLQQVRVERVSEWYCSVFR